jgi:hypothetical protein
VLATHDWKAAAMRLVVLCWPLLATVLTIVLWKLFSPAPARSLNTWRWDQKGIWLGITLRDQSFWLDTITTAAAFPAAGGAAAGRAVELAARLARPCVLILYVIIPSDINGSAFVDVRLLPPAMMLLLGLQDWSGARRRAKAVALAAWPCSACAPWSRRPALSTMPTITASSFPRSNISSRAAAS